MAMAIASTPHTFESARSSDCFGSIFTQAKANPKLAEKNLASADAKRERRGKAPLKGKGDDDD